ncbi:hypothetical protein GA840_04160 [Pediococcus ethanolidurans]|uniref:hypothetical protein n=1 Tax=Pediococcus ethanolidurans TaxID=319653 RepID=UPI00295309CE|nr:hypothetical protein [Pediococcus ethanolidurans]MDV7719041.1 hypothetical protein [Pediococcus ethanolidurans]
MNPHNMSFPEILDNFRDRWVTFTMKDKSQRKLYVEEIENQLDGWDDVIFMVTPPKNDPELLDILLNEIVSAVPGEHEPLNTNI